MQLDAGRRRKNTARGARLGLIELGATSRAGWRDAIVNLLQLFSEQAQPLGRISFSEQALARVRIANQRSGQPIGISASTLCAPSERAEIAK